MPFVMFELGLKLLLRKQSIRMGMIKYSNSFGNYLKLMLMLVSHSKPQSPLTSIDLLGSLDFPVSKGTIKKDSKKALKQLRTLGDLIYSNSEFRKLLVDANVLFRDMFADAASKVVDAAFEAAQSAGQMAEGSRPSQDELSSIDNAANGGQQKDKKLLSTIEMKDQAKQVGKDAKK